MCGITGIVDPTRAGAREALILEAERMTRTLTHRGPDAGGVWVDPAVGVALGHRRLAIVDLSNSGRQPMVSADGNVVLTYNGEIYNAPELRSELETHGCRFRGRSDSEVIVEACAVWGVRAAIERFIGMFAFAIWNRRERTLVIARDRLGIKPVYWTMQSGMLLFGSELDAIVANPGWEPEINRDALSEYLRRKYVPAPLSIYNNVYKLEPGCLLTWKKGNVGIESYWSVLDVAYNVNDGGQSEFDEREGLYELEALLSDAVSRRMIADVPLGAFLSGGIDSSLVVAIMQQALSQPVRTFTVGFNERDYDETRFARAVSEHLGTEHLEIVVDQESILAGMPTVASLIDEPFADESLVPLHLIARLARDHVSVVLSGDGGDELFNGYRLYAQVEQAWAIRNRIPGMVRRMLSERSVGLGSELFHRLTGRRIPADVAARYLNIARADRPEDIYTTLRCNDGVLPGLVLETGGSKEDLDWDVFPGSDGGLQRRLQCQDMLGYLPGDVLTKVDRATMTVGLEARVPILDHRLVELSWRIPFALKRRDSKAKWALRELLYKHVPRHLVDRPKRGFNVPVGQWLRGPLREWSDAQLDARRLRSEGIFDADAIQSAWENHCAERTAHFGMLWSAIVFQSWQSERGCVAQIRMASRDGERPKMQDGRWAELEAESSYSAVDS